MWLIGLCVVKDDSCLAVTWSYTERYYVMFSTLQSVTWSRKLIGWPKKWEREYDGRFNDLGLYLFMLLLIIGVVVWNSWL